MNRSGAMTSLITAGLVIVFSLFQTIRFYIDDDVVRAIFWLLLMAIASKYFASLFRDFTGTAL